MSSTNYAADSVSAEAGEKRTSKADKSTKIRRTLKRKQKRLRKVNLNFKASNVSAAAAFFMVL